MDNADELRKLQDSYARMSDGELEAVAAEAYDLTDLARPILRTEMDRRGLETPLVMEKGGRRASPETLELALAQIFWDPAVAAKAKQELDAAEIPGFWGPDHAESLEGLDVESGIDLSVRVEDLARVRAGLKEFADAEPEDFACVCPKCQSPEIVLVEVDESTKYHWSCDACGHSWEDDGVEAKA
ncbi:MAG TPA: hypothetical protein VMT15_04110 [Bryobacteraceae bacterium]|nr:hypothetical protein [Bryobacteraceae bacterium]